MTRLDKFLAEKYGCSRQYIQNLISAGRVTVAGQPVKKNLLVSEETPLRIDWPPTAPSTLLPEALPLTILYQDADLAVVNKPAGVTTHPYGRVLSGTLVNALLYHLKDLSGIGGVLRPGIVHRLDKETSGLMVVAKNDFAHHSLSEQFRNRQVEKCYLAFVKGKISWTEQEVFLPIGRKRGAGITMAVDFRRGRESQTVVRVKKRFAVATLVEVLPKTGRTHQIRVVLHFLGFPLIGDWRYGKRDELDRLTPRMALHAARLSFKHPRSGQTISFQAPLPNDLQQLKEELTNLPHLV